jgi:hypothetical protein
MRAMRTTSPPPHELSHLNTYDVTPAVKIITIFQFIFPIFSFTQVYNLFNTVSVLVPSVNSHHTTTCESFVPPWTHLMQRSRKKEGWNSQAQAVDRYFPLCVCMLASGMCSYVNAERCVFVAVLKAIDLRATGCARASQPASPPSCCPTDTMSV